MKLPTDPIQFSRALIDYLVRKTKENNGILDDETRSHFALIIDGNEYTLNSSIPLYRGRKVDDYFDHDILGCYHKGFVELRKTLSKSIEFPDEYKRFIQKYFGPPPKERTRAGRANREGVPYLYTAMQVNTVLHELRAQGGEQINIGVAHVAKEKGQLSLVTIDPIFDVNNTKRDFILSIYQDMFLKEAFLRPVERGNLVEYVPFQSFCDLMEQFGYDGVMYKSSLIHSDENTPFVEKPFNIVIFDNRNVCFSNCLEINLSNPKKKT